MQNALTIFLLVTSAFACGHRDDAAEPQPPLSHNIPSEAPKSPHSAPPEVSEPVTLGELNCNDKKGLITDCSFRNRTVAEKQAVLSTFTFSYSFKCFGDTLPITAEFEGNRIMLNQGEEGTLVLRGFGPLELKDQDPEATKFAYLRPGCSLDILAIKVEAIN